MTSLQAERMPEQLRLKVGTVERRQLIVYEEFGREIPGFANRTPQLTHNSANPNPAQMADPSDPRRMAVCITARHWFVCIDRKLPKNKNDLV